jgi:predicted O-methyltransferase YrrM
VSARAPAEVLAAVRHVSGWMTDAQAGRLWDAARRVPPGGRIVEVGSYHGRSTVVLAAAAPAAAEIVAIDPHAGNDRGPRQWTGTAQEGEADRLAFEATLARAGVRKRVRHVRRPSQEAFDAVEDPVHLVYVDGAHRFKPASQDIAGWGDRIAPGGTLLVHDAFSSVGVTAAVLRLLLLSDRFCYAGRSGSLAEYRREALTPAARAGSAAAQLAGLPWFARNLAVKAAIVARAPGLARALGHRSGPWPY